MSTRHVDRIRSLNIAIRPHHLYDPRLTAITATRTRLHWLARNKQNPTESQWASERVMNTLPSSSSKIAVDKFLVSPFLNRPEPRVLRSQKVADFGFLHLISVQHKARLPVVACLSSETQVFSVSRISLLFLGSRCFWFLRFCLYGTFCCCCCCCSCWDVSLFFMSSLSICV